MRYVSNVLLALIDRQWEIGQSKSIIGIRILCTYKYTISVVSSGTYKVVKCCLTYNLDILQNIDEFWQSKEDKILFRIWTNKIGKSNSLLI